MLRAQISSITGGKWESWEECSIPPAQLELQIRDRHTTDSSTSEADIKTNTPAKGYKHKPPQAGPPRLGSSSLLVLQYSSQRHVLDKKTSSINLFVERTEQHPMLSWFPVAQCKLNKFIVIKSWYSLLSNLWSAWRPYNRLVKTDQ